VGWGSDAVVPQDQGWELRCPAYDKTVALQVSLEGTDVRIHRTVLAAPAPPAAAAAVALQALRCNRRVRHARLAGGADGLVAEARLHGGLIQPRWLAMVAAAVVVAAQHAQPGLQILAEQEDVAGYYQSLFCGSGSLL
jgi:hypothetical protein